MFSVTEVTNSVSGSYRIKLRAAVMNSEPDTAQQELQPVVYTNVIGPRDWLLFQGPDILTLKLKQASTIWLLLPQTLLDFRSYFRILQPTHSRRNVQYVYHSLHTDRMGQISLHNQVKSKTKPNTRGTWFVDLWYVVWHTIHVTWRRRGWW